MDSDSYQHKQELLFSKIASGKAPASRVPIQESYTKKGLCLTIVSFLSPLLSKRLSSLFIEPLKSIEPTHFYYGTDALHLTVKNVRVVSETPKFTESDIEKVKAALDRLTPSLQPWTFEFRGIIPFPTSVSVKGYCAEYLRDVVRLIDHALVEAGVPDDKVYASDSTFFGNVTICRFTQRPSAQLVEKILALRDSPAGCHKVQNLHLISCDAVCSGQSLRVIGTYECGGLGSDIITQGSGVRNAPND